MTTTAIERERWRYEITSDDLTSRDHADKITRDLRTMTEEWLDEHLAVNSEEPKVTATTFQRDGQESVIRVRVTVQATLSESAGEDLRTQLKEAACDWMYANINGISEREEDPDVNIEIKVENARPAGMPLKVETGWIGPDQLRCHIISRDGDNPAATGPAGTAQALILLRNHYENDMEDGWGLNSRAVVIERDPAMTTSDAMMITDEIRREFEYPRPSIFTAAVPGDEKALCIGPGDTDDDQGADALYGRRPPK